MLNRDSSVPRCTIARQTARCACRRGQIAGTTKARPACVEVRIVRSRQWCEMAPCLEGEMCGLLFNRSGWTCTKASGHIKTVMVFFANHGRRGTEGNHQANTFCVDSPIFFSNHYIPSLHKSEEPYYVTVHRCPY
eukprot:XP_013991119.1 PREDICTED: protein FAM19A5-like isoform X2 [Salmo salar]